MRPVSWTRPCLYYTRRPNARFQCKELGRDCSASDTVSLFSKLAGYVMQQHKVRLHVTAKMLQQQQKLSITSPTLPPKAWIPIPHSQLGRQAQLWQWSKVFSALTVDAGHTSIDAWRVQALPVYLWETLKKGYYALTKASESSWLAFGGDYELHLGLHWLCRKFRSLALPNLALNGWDHNFCLPAELKAMFQAQWAWKVARQIEYKRPGSSLVTPGNHSSTHSFLTIVSTSKAFLSTPDAYYS